MLFFHYKKNYLIVVIVKYLYNTKRDFDLVSNWNSLSFEDMELYIKYLLSDREILESTESRRALSLSLLSSMNYTCLQNKYKDQRERLAKNLINKRPTLYI